MGDPRRRDCGGNTSGQDALHRTRHRQADSTDSKLSLIQGTVFLFSLEYVPQRKAAIPLIPPKLHMITGGDNFAASLHAAAQAAPWVDYVHLRNKTASAREMEAWALRLLQDGVPQGKLVINDRVDVALAVGACGVQLAWHSLRPSTVKNRWPHLLVGVSVHNPQETAEAFAKGADYVLFGHIYDSASKPGIPPRGLQLLEEAVLMAGKRPVIALGGIRPDHVPGLLCAGAAGYAVLSGIGGAADPALAARDYREAACKGGDPT